MHFIQIWIAQSSDSWIGNIISAWLHEDMCHFRYLIQSQSLKLKTIRSDLISRGTVKHSTVHWSQEGALMKKTRTDIDARSHCMSQTNTQHSHSSNRIFSSLNKKTLLVWHDLLKEKLVNLYAFGTYFYPKQN